MDYSKKGFGLTESYTEAHKGLYDRSNPQLARHYGVSNNIGGFADLLTGESNIRDSVAGLSNTELEELMSQGFSTIEDEKTKREYALKGLLYESNARRGGSYASSGGIYGGSRDTGSTEMQKFTTSMVTSMAMGSDNIGQERQDMALQELGRRESEEDAYRERQQTGVLGRQIQARQAGITVDKNFLSMTEEAQKQLIMSTNELNTANKKAAASATEFSKSLTTTLMALGGDLLKAARAGLDSGMGDIQKAAMSGYDVDQYRSSKRTLMEDGGLSEGQADQSLMTAGQQSAQMSNAFAAKSEYVSQMKALETSGLGMWTDLNSFRFMTPEQRIGAQLDFISKQDSPHLKSRAAIHLGQQNLAIAAGHVTKDELLKVDKNLNEEAMRAFYKGEREGQYEFQRIKEKGVEATGYEGGRALAVGEELAKNTTALKALTALMEKIFAGMAGAGLATAGAGAAAGGTAMASFAASVAKFSVIIGGLYAAFELAGLIEGGIEQTLEYGDMQQGMPKYSNEDRQDISAQNRFQVTLSQDEWRQVREGKSTYDEIYNSKLAKGNVTDMEYIYGALKEEEVIGSNAYLRKQYGFGEHDSDYYTKGGYAGADPNPTAAYDTSKYFSQSDIQRMINKAESTEMKYGELDLNITVDKMGDLEYEADATINGKHTNETGNSYD